MLARIFQFHFDIRVLIVHVLDGGYYVLKNYIDFKILQSVKFFCDFSCFVSLPDDSSILKLLVSFTVSFGFVLVSFFVV